MRILSVTAQKPDSTGSGVYLTELVKGFAGMGHTQAVIAGVYAEDQIQMPDGVICYPVYYNSQELNFPILGMSDEMPYDSTKYSEMTDEMTENFKNAFRKRIERAVQEFRPEVILCHHLYFLTAYVRELCPDQRVYGLCHGSDMRQVKKNPWQRAYICSQIRKLDGILALHEEQKKEIEAFYECQSDKVIVLGTGYNSKVFYRENVDENEKQKSNGGKLCLVFAGKISEKKGVMSLIRSMNYIPEAEERVLLQIAGGHGNTEEYQKITELAEECPCEVAFLGKLSQTELAKVFRQGDVFVLPSFYEGLPLVLIEAMACGMQTVCTDLPGIQEWVERNVPGNEVVFVTPPEMENEDEPVKAALPEFEQKLADAVLRAANCKSVKEEVLRKLSWEGVCKRLIQLWAQ